MSAHVAVVAGAGGALGQATALTLAASGLTAGVGLSNVSLDQLRHAAAGTGIVCVQNLFHLADRRSAPVLQECLSRGIAFVPSCSTSTWDPRCG